MKFIRIIWTEILEFCPIDKGPDQTPSCVRCLILTCAFPMSHLGTVGTYGLRENPDWYVRRIYTVCTKSNNLESNNLELKGKSNILELEGKNTRFSRRVRNKSEIT